LNDHLYTIVSNSKEPETLSNWSKFLVRYKVEDTEIWNRLSERCAEYAHHFTVDEFLTILVNVSHSLATDAG